MRTTAGMVAALALAAGLAACGDDDDKAADEPKKIEVRCTPAPGSPKKLAFSPKFKPGDKRAVTIDKTRTAGTSGEATVKSDAVLSVVSGGPRKAVLRWDAGAVSLPILENADPDTLERFQKEAQRVATDYSTGSEGQVGEVRNPEEVRASMNRVLDIFSDLDPKAKFAADRVRPLLRNDDALRAGLREPLALHGLYGLELAPNKPLETPYSLPNPLGGDPIDATATFELETLRDRDGCAVVHMVVEADPGAMRKFLLEFFERAGGGQAPPESQLAGIKMTTTATYRYDAGSGWVAEVDAKREQSLAGQTRTETTVVRTAPG